MLIIINSSHIPMQIFEFWHYFLCPISHSRFYFFTGFPLFLSLNFIFFPNSTGWYSPQRRFLSKIYTSLIPLLRNLGFQALIWHTNVSQGPRQYGTKEHKNNTAVRVDGGPVYNVEYHLRNRNLRRSWVAQGGPSPGSPPGSEARLTCCLCSIKILLLYHSVIWVSIYIDKLGL